MKEYSRSPSLPELIRMAIARALADVHVSLPGSVQAYDPATQRADVQPLLRRTLVASDGTELAAETLPILMDVPVVFPRGGGGFVSWPLAKGDLVHVVFVEASIDQWLDGDGELTTPSDFRRHSLSDAVAYPGLYPRGRALADAHAENLVWGFDGGAQVHVRPDGEVHLASNEAADYVALAQLVKDEITALRNTVDSLVTTFNAHVHPGVTSGPASTAPTVTPGTPPAAVGDVAAEKVKAD